MIRAIRTRLERLENVALIHPLKGLPAEEQVAAFFARSGTGWRSQSEQQAWINDMSDEALDLAIVELTMRIEVPVEHAAVNAGGGRSHGDL